MVGGAGFAKYEMLNGVMTTHLIKAKYNNGLIHLAWVSFKTGQLYMEILAVLITVVVVALASCLTLYFKCKRVQVNTSL